MHTFDCLRINTYLIALGIAHQAKCAWAAIGRLAVHWQDASSTHQHASHKPMPHLHVTHVPQPPTEHTDGWQQAPKQFSHLLLASDGTTDVPHSKNRTGHAQ